MVRRASFSEPIIGNIRMRITGLCMIATLAFAAAISSAVAQQKKDAAKMPAGPAGQEVRYFTSLNGLMGDQADVVLKETRQAGKVTAATLDVCFPAVTSSARMDRFTLDLAIDGAKASGSTTSLEDKLPVTVNLVRKVNGKAVDFAGKIAVGNTVSDVDSTENTDISDRDFKDAQSFDDKIVGAPKDFTEVSPESIAVKVKRTAVTDFVTSLRGEHAQIALYSLAASCAELRSGEQIIRLSVDPERAAATIAKLKAEPGVVDAGWTDGSFDMDRTIRFAAASFSEGGKINRNQLAATISPVIAKALGATAQASKWDDDTGELTLTYKRQNQVIPALNLTDTIEVTALVSMEKPTSGDKLVLWVSNPSVTTTDDNSGPKLNLADPSNGDDDESATDDDGGMVEALAKELKAQRWDSDNSAWR
jgi:hypothetical protein